MVFGELKYNITTTRVVVNDKFVARSNATQEGVTTGRRNDETEATIKFEQFRIDAVGNRKCFPIAKSGSTWDKDGTTDYSIVVEFKIGAIGLSVDGDRVTFVEQRCAG